MRRRETPVTAAFEDNLLVGRRRMVEQQFDEAWSALELAHVLGQTDAVLHVRSHWWMLRCGIRQGDTREVLGQAVRVVLAAPSSWLRRYPRGNTGRARVGLFTPMPMPPEVEMLLKKSEGGA